MGSRTKSPIPKWFMLLFIATLVSAAITLTLFIIWMFSRPFTASAPEAIRVTNSLPVDQKPAEGTTGEPAVSVTTPLGPTSEPVPSTTSPLPPTTTTMPSPVPTMIPTIDPWVVDQIDQLNVRQKIGQMLMIGVDGQQISNLSCKAIQDLTPGAVIYRGVNVVNPEQLRTFSADLQKCARDSGGIPLWIAIDHEGQYVTRFKSGVTVFPAAMAQGATGNPTSAYQVAKAAGGELAFSGVNMVLGPVGDILKDYDNAVISQRAFSGDPQLTSAFVVQAVSGYLDAKVAPVLKHYPGHGGVPGDSHYTLPVDTSDRRQLDITHLPPFRAGLTAGAPLVMTSHVAFPNIDETGNPATLSHPLLRILRKDLSFDGVIMSDSMTMGGITGRGISVPDAAVQAVNAGVDLLLVAAPEQAFATQERLLRAVDQGEISTERIDEALSNLLRVKTVFGRHLFPLPDKPTPDWEAHEILAYEIGYQSVTLLRNEAGHLPISPLVERILVIGPTDGWGLYPILKTALQENGLTFNMMQYSNPWKGAVPETDYLNSVPVQASQYDLVLFLTWEAHLNRIKFDDTWQPEMAERLLATGIPLIVVALKSPTDILEFPQVSTYLATFGTTKGQLQGMADILTGRSVPKGHNPLPSLP